MTHLINNNGPAKLVPTVGAKFESRGICPVLIGTIGLTGDAPAGKGNLQPNLNVGRGLKEASVGAGLKYTQQLTDNTGYYVNLQTDKTFGIKDQVKYENTLIYDNVVDTYKASYPINTQRLVFGGGLTKKDNKGNEFSMGASIMHTKAEIPTESPMKNTDFDSWGGALNLGVKFPDKYGATEVNAYLGGNFKDNSGSFGLGVTRYF
jgi:hypothetical protein